MSKDRRKLYGIAGIFALLLVVGVVYAATTGTLFFNGTAGLNTNVRLNIVDEAITDPKQDESVSVNAAKDTLTFTVHLDNPGDTRYVKFKINNAGNTDAILGTLSTTPPAAASGVTVNWPSLDGVIINTGDTSTEYTVEVHWNPSYPNATQDVSLSASINYQQHAP